MRLFLIRHGESLWKKELRIQGCGSDIALNEVGIEQAGRVASALRNERLAAIYSSPLKRTIDTARPLSQITNLEINIDHGLREIDAGELEGQSIMEMSKSYKESWMQWAKGSPLIPLPGGESLQELQDRSWKAIQFINDKHSNDTVVVISHLFAILTIICRVMGLELPNMWKLRQTEAGITIIDVTPVRPTLLLFNCTGHLEA
jgi:broad specificity phosphatase PhoE